MKEVYSLYPGNRRYLIPHRATKGKPPVGAIGKSGQGYLILSPQVGVGEAG